MLRRTSGFISAILLLALALGSAGPALAQDTAAGREFHIERDSVPVKDAEYSPYVDQHFPNRVFFGDTHHHSSYSFDSGMFGNTLGPEDSFRFARGEEVRASNGMSAKLIRPLDFLVVSDHAAYLGFTDLIKNADPGLMATTGGREITLVREAGEWRLSSSTPVSRSMHGVGWS